MIAGILQMSFQFIQTGQSKSCHPNQSSTKVTGNILHCLKHGCQIDWLIDPGERSLLFYPAEQQPDFLQEEQEVLPILTLVSKLELTVEDIFS